MHDSDDRERGEQVEPRAGRVLEVLNARVAASALVAAVLVVCVVCGAGVRAPEPAPAAAPDDLARAAATPEPEDEPEVAPAPRHGFDLDGTGEVPWWVRDTLSPYLDARRARLSSFGPGGKSLLVLSRLGETMQAYQVLTPLGARKQLTFEDSPIEQVSFVPFDTRTIVFRADRDGDECFQIYVSKLGTGRARLLTDGRS